MGRWGDPAKPGNHGIRTSGRQGTADWEMGRRGDRKDIRKWGDG
jgi:hypothetical protein